MIVLQNIPMASGKNGSGSSGIIIEQDNSASKASIIRDSIGSASGSIPSRMTENGQVKHDGEVPFNFSDIIQNE
tara:strand:+ start:893 stop:1114 length:222 start_codon:yes stop_codon:yes gene_type:complete